MLKISITETATEYRLALKGGMVGSGLTELTTICTRLRAGLRGRMLVIDIKDVMLISQEGENCLLELINNGARLRPEGVLANRVLQQLAYRSKKKLGDLINTSANVAAAS
jgi:hypothetical protein